MTGISQLLSSVVPHESGDSVVVPPDWLQGRTTFGGITAALSIASALSKRALPPLRSAQFAFMGPVEGSVELVPQELRVGRSSAYVGVDVTCDSRLSARSLLLFAEGRESRHRSVPCDMPSVPPPEDCPDFFDSPDAPKFSAHFEARLALGSPMLSGASEPSYHVWVRHRDEDTTEVPAMTRLIALADVLPPPILALADVAAPVSTMTWSIDVVLPADSAQDALDGRGWHLLGSHAEAMADGYSAQAMHVWRPDGTRVLTGRQVVAAFF
jgi:acyl-CoA thioesterase